MAEVALFRALSEGLAPVQMTFEGYNFDIVTGVLALFLGVIVFIALTSMPTPLRLFMNEPSNIWVTGSPYILLPGVWCLRR